MQDAIINIAPRGGENVAVSVFPFNGLGTAASISFDPTLAIFQLNGFRESDGGVRASGVCSNP